MIALNKKAEERALWEAYWRNPTDANRNAIVERNIGLAGDAARRRFAEVVGLCEFQDLVQIGTMGIIRAVAFWQPEKARFSTYASRAAMYEIDRWIMKRIREHYRFANYADRKGRLDLAEEITDQEPDVEGLQRRKAVARGLACLRERERNVIERRMQGERLHEIGADLGVTVERVRQIQCTASKQLRNYCGVTDGG